MMAFQVYSTILLFWLHVLTFHDFTFLYISKDMILKMKRIVIYCDDCHKMRFHLWKLCPHLYRCLFKQRLNIYLSVSIDINFTCKSFKKILTSDFKVLLSRKHDCNEEHNNKLNDYVLIDTLKVFCWERFN